MKIFDAAYPLRDLRKLLRSMQKDLANLHAQACAHSPIAAALGSGAEGRNAEDIRLAILGSTIGEAAKQRAVAHLGDLMARIAEARAHAALAEQALADLLKTLPVTSGLLNPDQLPI